MAGRSRQVNGVDKLLAELRSMVADAGEALSSRYEASTRPRLVELMNDSATVAIRAAAGEDVTTATAALESSIYNISRTERSQLILDGRQLALKVAVQLALKLAAAAA